MQKRLTFKCCNSKCQREYSLLFNLQGRPKLAVECPYCSTEAIADLDPFRDNCVEVFKGDKSDKSHISNGLNLPNIIPTTPPNA